MKDILNYLFYHNTLTKAEAKSILLEIAMNKFNDNEVTAFVSIFLMRTLTLEELEGFQEALLVLSVPVELDSQDLVDIVGTGGDGKNTFNISTLASFVVAGAGQRVAKHGNYGISTISGSSNVLEELGYTFKTNSDGLQRDLDQAGICFLHAPLFHPALRTVAPLRKGLGLRTFFNILGPLVNPARPKYTMIGVYSLEIARLYQYLLQKHKANFLLVHALDGYDEISLTSDTKLFDRNGESIQAPEDLGYSPIAPERIYGGESKSKAAQIFKSILEGTGTKEQNAVVIANAAMALKNTEKFGDYDACRSLATDSLKSGKALNCLNALVN